MINSQFTPDANTFAPALFFIASLLSGAFYEPLRDIGLILTISYTAWKWHNDIKKNKEK